MIDAVALALVQFIFNLVLQFLVPVKIPRCGLAMFVSRRNRYIVEYFLYLKFPFTLSNDK